ncbi:hypothetical protein MSAN_00364900 [Mycena sanguinolenta]|uniref:Uncharacterized protein n=1 Tax=Mycena sanguinolenta TaxID=230812 RepID=A0A8H6ZCJ7_9AGAR|nr:hypothetical protein MSAN_00364900 [Mycena sanguinolenta]
MPALPSTAPSVPALPPPLVLLAIFVVVFTVITCICAVYPVVASCLAARRVRRSDEESACGGSTAPIAAKARKASASAPAEVLFNARTAIFVLKAKRAAEKELAAFHKTLMAGKTAPQVPQRVEAGASVVSRFIQKQIAIPTKGHTGARRKRSLPGPSPLRSVYTAPEPAPEPKSTPAPASALPTTTTTPIIPAPASPTIPKGPTALILAALARGDLDSDTASINEEDQEGIAPSITFDAIRGIWTAKKATSGEPQPDTHTNIESEIDAILARFPAPPPYAPVLVDNRLRTLWREGKEKKKLAGAGSGEMLKGSPEEKWDREGGEGKCLRCLISRLFFLSFLPSLPSLSFFLLLYARYT